MPALPWVEHSPIRADQHYVAMASCLPLERHRSIPRFLRETMRIRRQLAATPGLVGYGLNAQLGRKTFWTFSVWDSQSSLDTFAASDPHREIIQRLRPIMSETAFAFFPIVGSDARLSWQAVAARLDEDSTAPDA